MLHVKVLCSVEELRSVSRHWNHLLERSLNDSLTLTWEWLSHWVDTYLGKGQPFCVAVYDDENLVGLAPFWVERRRQIGIGSLKVLRFLGSEEICSDHLDLIISRKNSEAICRAIWEHLYGPYRKRWDVLEYNYVPVDSQILQSFRNLSDHDDRCLAMIITEYSICPYISLPDTWDGFVATLSANSRRSLNVSTELINQAGSLKFRVCDNIGDLPSDMQRHIALHRKSWNDRGQRGNYTKKQFERFHSELSEDLLAKGKLFLCFLELSGTPVASFYGFEHKKVIYSYLLGVDRSAVPKAGIGRVLLGQTIKAAIERGCREFDLLRGWEEYKYYWTDKERRELSVTFYNRSFNALVYILTQFLNRYTKQVAKTFLGGKTGAVKSWLGKGKPKSGEMTYPN